MKRPETYNITLLHKVVISFFVMVILLSRNIPALGEWYSSVIYPVISQALGIFSSYFPFSLYDIVWTSVVLAVFILLLLAISGKLKVKVSVSYLVTIFIWFGIGFYFSWGMNYFRYSFYERNAIKRASFDENELENFTVRFIDELNNSYYPVAGIDSVLVAQVARNGYTDLAEKLNIDVGSRRPAVKSMIYSRTMAGMGIKGYIGAFFNEATVNDLLRAEDYPFTYIHELAHIYGISSEAEANLYAFLICSRSSYPEIRYSGYLSLLPYVLANASMLPKDKFEEIKRRISPEIKKAYMCHRDYWSGLYSPVIGSIQDWLYDSFLKGNSIESGVNNYYEVIGYLISYEHSLKNN